MSNRNRRRPDSARVRGPNPTPRDRVGRSSTQTPRHGSSQTPRSHGSTSRDRDRSRNRPVDIDVGPKTSASVTNLFTRPTTPSKSSKTPSATSQNGHSKQSSMSAGLDNEPEPDLSRPTFQFKIGMRVGVALGECFLQVQRLESSVVSIHHISDQIRDFMNFLQESFSETRPGGNRSASPTRDGQQPPSSPIPEDSEPGETITPFQRVIALNETLELSQLDCSKRMTSLLKGLKNLQIRLEDMDEVKAKLDRTSHHASQSADVQLLRSELDKARAESSTYRRQADDARRKYEETKAQLETRESQLDNDAEAIERQSEHLRADTERLLKEKEDVRRQKDNWQALIEEQKELKEQLNRREQELNESQKQLIALQNTLAQKEAHLHRKAKKLRGRERRINQNLMSLRPAGSSYAGSDYAASEASSKLTYFSDGDTEIASVNSLSDDDMDSRYGH